MNGDKSGVRKDTIIAESLARGISFAAINYRYRTAAPIQDILRDCARAVQFLRSQSNDWNIDKTRFAAYGGSAGAGTSLWLAFHDDLADSKSEDPILRESSRLICAGAISTQFSYDLPKWKELFGEQAKSPAEELLMPFFYGFTKKEDLDTERGKAIRADCDMCGLIDRSDPPVFLTSKQPGGNVSNHNHLLHHPLHAKTIYDTCRTAGIPAVADLPGLKIKPAASDPADLRKFLYHHLQAAKPN